MSSGQTWTPTIDQTDVWFDRSCLEYGRVDHVHWERLRPRFFQKLLRYDAYYQLGAYHDHLGELGLRPRLLIVAPDGRREKKLVDWIARRLSRADYAHLPTILVAARDLVFLDILGPIWRRPGDESRARFID